MSIENSLPRRSRLAGAVFLGFVNALWALFQWAELLLARSGSTPFCAIDETFNCNQVWDSAFASTIHNATLMPLAGWGLVWGIAATVLPLLALVDDRLLGRGLSAALRFTALAGVASVAAFATASAIAGALCIGCIGTYIAVALWSAVVWTATGQTSFAEAPRGAAFAVALVIAGYLILLVPGMRTPHATAKLTLPDGGSGAGKPAVVVKDTPAAPKKPSEFDGPPTGDPARDELLGRFMASLDGQSLQAMANLLAAYRDGKTVDVKPGRSFAIGAKGAPVQIVEWTDPLCPHCAQLHGALGEISKSIPPGLFNVDSRHFPLDGFCNSGVTRKSEDGLRCVGAKAQICLEGDPAAFEASGALFAARAATVDGVYEALKPFRDPAKLKTCVAAPKTQKLLDDDIQQGLALNIDGTPLVILNGKEVNPFGPLIYALILTGGSPRHEAFRDLPAPKAQAADSHAGHAH